MKLKTTKRNGFRGCGEEQFQGGLFFFNNFKAMWNRFFIREPALLSVGHVPYLIKRKSEMNQKCGIYSFF